jgi:hypothetical protein
VLEKALLLGGGKKAYEGRHLPLPGGKIRREVKGGRRVACVSCKGILCLPLGTRMEDVRRKPTTAGMHRASLHAIGPVNSDEIGRSHPIGAPSRPAWYTAWLVTSQGYATTQNHVTSV